MVKYILCHLFLDFGIVEAKAKDLAEFQSYVPSNFLGEKNKRFDFDGPLKSIILCKVIASF